MAYTYLHPNFPAASGGPTGPARVKYPFWGEGDTTTITIETDWIQSWSTYKPLTLNTPIDFAKIKSTGFTMPSNASACIFLEDSEPTDIGFGCCIVVRTWGTVPIDRKSPVRLSVGYFGTAGVSLTYQVRSAFTYKTGARSQYYNNTSNVTSAAVSVNNSPLIGTRVYGVFGVQYFLQSNGLGSPVTLGGFVAIKYQRRAKITSVGPVVISDENGWTPSQPIDMGVYIEAGGGTAQATFLGWSDTATPSKGPRSRLVSGHTIYRYYTGINKAIANAPTKLEIITSAGAVTDTIASDSDINMARWREMLNNGESFIPEDSTIDRWRGDIYEVATHYVPAKP